VPPSPVGSLKAGALAPSASFAAICAFLSSLSHGHFEDLRQHLWGGASRVAWFRVVFDPARRITRKPKIFDRLA
jgi:hypothetical protein